MSRREYTVDGHGRMDGFVPLDDADEIGPFGDGLSAGDVVECHDGKIGVVAKVYRSIHTGGCGASNYEYVYVDVLVEDEPRDRRKEGEMSEATWIVAWLAFCGFCTIAMIIVIGLLWR